MDLKLEGRRVLVTGGSKGIGLGVSLSFAREGAQPVLVSRSAAALGQAISAIRNETGVDAQALALDLCTTNVVENLVATAGSVDIVVNNAGAILGGSLHDVDDPKWRQSWEL